MRGNFQNTEGAEMEMQRRRHIQPWLWLLGVQREKEKTTGIQTKENREDRRLEAFKTPVGQVLSMEPQLMYCGVSESGARIFYKV